MPPNPFRPFLSFRPPFFSSSSSSIRSSISRHPLHSSLLSNRSFLLLQLCFLTHLVSTYVFEISLTAGASMLPTLNVRGDVVYISKWHRRGRGVRRGDLVTIRHPLLPGERASKRVIGMPGDYVLRNTPPTQPVSEAAAGAGHNMVQVPEGHVWLAGDNAPWSRDSRDFGPVPMALIRGKVVAKVWPLGEAKWLGSTFERVREG